MAAARKKTGRPTTLSAEAAAKVCASIAEGNSLAKIGKMPGMPSQRTIFRWLATQDAEGETAHEAFRQQYVRAREIRADARFERIDQVIGDMRAKRVSYNEARVEIDAIKWQAGKENAKRYGEAVTLKGDKDNPLEVRDAKDLSDAELLAIAASVQRAGG